MITSSKTTALAAALLAAGSIASAEPIQFNRDIRPILSDNCFSCHGPDAHERKAGLRLDTHEGALADNEGTRAIVPGDLTKSELVHRITTADREEQMPPPKSGLSLTQQEKETLGRWIAVGAPWEEHWSLVPPEKRPLPAVKNTAWQKNEIDHFVLAKLESENLSPSPQANPETLIRRLSLDLTGIPPTPAEVEDFVARSVRNPESAAEGAVDRLLASPRFGEHMAWEWMEAARYADTDGYQYDGPRTMWRWRDWVIDAYNNNMPFDQFTIEQLAGDLLPNPTLDQIIATGFNRNHRYNSESGIVAEEYLLENAVDRVDTTATVWMGLTMGCARCHDHKFDPISIRDYYRMISFFDNVPESGRAMKFGNSEPYITAPTEPQAEKLAEFQSKIDAATQAFAALESDITRAQSAWEKTLARPPADFPPASVTRSLAGHLRFDGNLDNSVPKAPAAKPRYSKTTFVPGPVGQAIRFDTSTVEAPAFGDIRNTAPYTISFWVRPEKSTGTIFGKTAKAINRNGIFADLEDGHLRFAEIQRWIAGVIMIESVQTLPVKEWSHVTIATDGTQRATTVRLFLNGQSAPFKILLNCSSNRDGNASKEPFIFGARNEGHHMTGAIDDFRVYNRSITEEEVSTIANPNPVTEIAQFPIQKRSAADREKIRRHFLSHAAPANVRAAEKAILDSRAALEKYRATLPTTMVMREMSPPRETHIRLRGVYDQPGEKVTPGVPAIFFQSTVRNPKTEIRNRLDLARWLTSQDHPLTARVAVNRYWQRLLGLGLVRTPEDFGSQGQPPTHPDLLDWLAVDFIESGWDIKATLKRIALSATYRQSAAVSPALLERDPLNLLLARAPRHRLPAHVLRDQALALGSLLVEEIGGPSVYPYQPANIWKEIAMAGTYKDGTGKDLYRRSLYTIWKRTINPPSMAVLDAADRESCVVRPKRTNTPVQALALLNETAFVESARNLATRCISDPSPVESLFQTATSRPPNPSELAILKKAHADYLATFKSDPEAAKKLLATGASPIPKDQDPIHLAALTTLANVILNLDETLTKP